MAVLAVSDVGGEAVDLLFLLTRLHINEFHFGLKTTSLLFQILVFELLLFQLLTISGSLRPMKQDTRAEKRRVEQNGRLLEERN